MTAMCGVQLKDRRKTKDLKLKLGLGVAIDQLALANSEHWGMIMG